MIERVEVNRALVGKIEEWKRLRRDGWELTALSVDRRRRGLRHPVSVVCFGYRSCS